MENVPFIYRAFFGLGQLVCDDQPPIAVRYDIVAKARQVDGEQQWEWEKAEGFVTLVDNADIGFVDPGKAYTLEFPDGSRCRPVLRHEDNMSPARFVIECPPGDLVEDRDRPP